MADFSTTLHEKTFCIKGVLVPYEEDTNSGGYIEDYKITLSDSDICIREYLKDEIVEKILKKAYDENR